MSIFIRNASAGWNCQRRSGGRISRSLSCPSAVPEAAERLQLKQQVAYQLVKAGLWPVTRAWGSGRAIRLVPAEALAEFKRDYVTASELAQSVGTSPRCLIDALDAQGIKPITGPGVDDGRQFFFRREGLLDDAMTRATFPFGEPVLF